MSDTRRPQYLTPYGFSRYKPQEKMMRSDSMRGVPPIPKVKRGITLSEDQAKQIAKVIRMMLRS